MLPGGDEEAAESDAAEGGGLEARRTWVGCMHNHGKVGMDKRSRVWDEHANKDMREGDDGRRREAGRGSAYLGRAQAKLG